MKATVQSVMKYNPEVISPENTLKEAAQKMAKIGCGVLPVATKETPLGVITDRDIVIRALAKGKDVATEKVRDYMTSDVFFCEAEDTLEEAAEQMHTNHVSRLVVIDSGGKISGILSFGCILRKHPDLQEITSIVSCAVGKKAA